MPTGGTDPGTRAPSAHPRATRTALLLSALTAVATVPALFGGFLWDDWSLIVQNRLLSPPVDWWALLTTPFWDTSAVEAREGFGAYAGLHRPFLKAAYAVQKALFGSEPLGFHAVNWLLHAVNAGLVFAWIRRRWATAEPRLATAAAAAGSLLFALHPTRAESVGWISGSTDTWMTFWALLALLVAEARRPWATGIAALAAALAAWSKEPVWIIATIPWLDALAEPRGQRNWWPTWAVGGGTVVAVAASAPVLLAAADAPAWVSLDVGSVPSRALATLGAYASRLVFPWPASIRPFPFVVEDGQLVYSSGLIAVGGVVAAAIIAGVAVALRPPRHARALAELALAVLPLVPALNLLPRNFDTLAADRFLYLPSVGVAALLARAIVWASTSWPAIRGALAFATTALLSVLAYGTATSFAYLQSDLALREHEVAVHPDDARSRLNLGTVYFNESRPRDAREVALRGLEEGHGHIAPDDELELVSLLARGYLATSSDADRDTLRAIASYLDGVLDGTEVRLHVSVVRFHRPYDRVAHHWHIEHERQLRIDRGTVALRLGDLARAERELAPHATEQGVGPCIALAHARARQTRFDAALVTLNTCSARLDDPAPLDRALGRMQRAQLLASQPAADSRSSALRDASVALLLGAPQAARDALEAELTASPADPQLVQVRLQADIDDARLDLAEQVILRARAAAADPRPYDALLERLRREGGAAARQSPR